MGKSGELLRAKKANVVYTFTREQLRQHDHMVADDAIKANKELTRIENLKLVDEAWEKKVAEFKSSDRYSDIMNMLKYMCSISLKVLIEDFEWKTPKTKGRPVKILKFMDCIEREVKSMKDDEHTAIKEYSEKVFEKYGVAFGLSEEDIE